MDRGQSRHFRAERAPLRLLHLDHCSGGAQEQPIGGAGHMSCGFRRVDYTHVWGTTYHWIELRSESLKCIQIKRPINGIKRSVSRNPLIFDFWSLPVLSFFRCSIACPTKSFRCTTTWPCVLIWRQTRSRAMSKLRSTSSLIYASSLCTREPTWRSSRQKWWARQPISKWWDRERDSQDIN